MAFAITTPRLKLVSKPYKRRAGLLPMIIMLGISWVFVLIWGTLALWIYIYNPLYSIIIGASTIAFSFLLYVMSYKTFADGKLDYELEVNDSEAVLMVKDNLHHKRSQQMVLLDDVKFAEYYPFTDSASVILHAPYADMEVPLWPMENQGQDLIDFLVGRGVNVVNVQSDDKIPE